MKTIAKRVLETLITTAILLLLVTLVFMFAVPLLIKTPTAFLIAIVLTGAFLTMYSQICDWDKRAKEKSEFELCQMRAEFLQHKVNKYEEAIMSLEDEKIKEYLINKIKEND